MHAPPLIAHTLWIADALRAGCEGQPAGAFEVVMEIAAHAMVAGAEDAADVVSTSLVALRDPERLAVLIAARASREAERRVATVRRSATYATPPVAAGYVRRGSPKAVHRSNSRQTDQRWDADRE